MGPYANRPFNGPLPPGAIPTALFPPMAVPPITDPTMPGPPIPPPSSFSEPMYPGGFGLMSFGSGRQPFERERFQGDLIHTGSSQQHAQNNPPVDKEQEKQAINLNIHIHNPNDMKKLTKKAVEVKTSKQKIATIKQIPNINKELPKRKGKAKESTSNMLTFLEPRERIEREKLVDAMANKLQTNGRRPVPALPKTIPNKYVKQRSPSNRVPIRPPLHPPVVEPGRRDVLSLQQSRSSIYLQMPTPKSVYLMNEGPIGPNIGIPNQHIQAKYGPPSNALGGPYSNDKIKPGLLGVPGSHGEKNVLLKTRGHSNGNVIPSSPISSTPYKNSVPSSISNDPYINENLNNNPPRNSLKKLPQKLDRQNGPTAKHFSGQVQKRKINKDIPEIKSELKAVDYGSSNTGSPSQNTYNQMLLSLMIIMLQQQQIDKARERMNRQNSNQLPYQPSIPTAPYQTAPPYQPPVPPNPYPTAPPYLPRIPHNQYPTSPPYPSNPYPTVQPSAFNQKQPEAAYIEPEKAVLSPNQQSGRVLSALQQRDRHGNLLNGAMESLQNQLAMSKANAVLDQANIEQTNPYSKLGGQSKMTMQSNAKKANEIYPNSGQVTNNLDILEQRIQAKASAFEYPNELNVVRPNYAQNQGNVLLLQTNPIDKSVHIAPSSNILGKALEPPSSQTKSQYEQAPALGHGVDTGQYSSLQQNVGGQEFGQASPYQSPIGQNIVDHQPGLSVGVPASTPEKASISVPASDLPFSSSQIHGSNTYNSLGLVLDVTDIKPKSANVLQNPHTSSSNQNIPQNDLNSKLDRLIALFERQSVSSAQSNSANTASHVKLPPASLKRTNPQLYEEILEQNAVPKSKTKKRVNKSSKSSKTNAKEKSIKKATDKAAIKSKAGKKKSVSKERAIEKQTKTTKAVEKQTKTTKAVEKQTKLTNAVEKQTKITKPAH